MKIVDADEDFGTTIDQETSKMANVGKLSFKSNDDAEISILDDDEEEDEPIVVLVNNRVDELKMIGKFKSTSWNNVDPEDTLSKIKQEINSPSPSHSDVHNNNRPIKVEPIDRLERRRHDSSDSDISIKRSRHGQIEKSRRHDSSDSDRSLEKPGRRNKSRSPSNHSIEKRKKTEQRRRHDLSDSDQSLERRPTKKENDDNSGRKRHCSPNSDKSVERRRNRKEKTRTLSDKRRHSPDSDQSVERRSSRTAKTSRNDQDSNRQIIKAEPDEETIACKIRRRHSSDSDISVDRNRTNNEDRKSKNSERSSRIDNNSSKLNEPVKRKAQYDKDRGRKKKRELTEEEKKRQEELKKKYEVWNKGVKQVKDRQEKLDEMADLIDKPLARYRDDKDLDEHLKTQLLEEDPMSEYMHKKAVAENKSSGNAPKVSIKPKYKGQAPANRYGILPGYRWDGVDRSNGFENKLLSQANVKK
uniref:BUD13 homolog n=1 Tax=Romanomermis culicivorax TaxID=13658 RepID=A0A915L374_ROMCU